MTSFSKSSKDLLSKLKIETLFQPGLHKTNSTVETSQMKLKKTKDTILKEMDTFTKKPNPFNDSSKKLTTVLNQVEKDKHPRFTSTSDKSLNNFKEIISKLNNPTTQALDFTSSLTKDKYKQICTSDKEEFMECIQNFKYEILKNMQFTSLTQTEKDNIKEYANYQLSQKN